jgi:hypothetical protein
LCKLSEPHQEASVFQGPLLPQQIYKESWIEVISDLILLLIIIMIVLRFLVFYCLVLKKALEKPEKALT